MYATKETQKKLTFSTKVRIVPCSQQKVLLTLLLIVIKSKFLTSYPKQSNSKFQVLVK